MALRRRGCCKLKVLLVRETGADCNKKVFTVFSRKCFPQSRNNLRDLQGEYFRCPPTIILIFGYVIEDRK